jgi:uncharacterized membrane protein YkoI
MEAIMTSDGSSFHPARGYTKLLIMRLSFSAPGPVSFKKHQRPVSDRCYSGIMTYIRSVNLRRLALRAGLVLPLLGVALGLTTGTQAGDHQAKARELAAIRAAVQRGELLPLPRIMALAQARVPGDVVKTELEAKHGRLIYEVKILTPNGSVQEVKLDARAGTILRVEDD